ELIIPATVLTAEASQTKTFQATGEEKVGEKATGVVTIVNKSEDEKQIPAGTVLTANSLEFTTNAAAVVPAAEETLFITTNGQVDVSVTAVAIGPDSNIKKDTTFSVGGYDQSTMMATNTEAFSGGSEETITVVTENDRQQALESLAQAVQDEAMNALQKKVSGGQLLLDDAATPETASTDFSHEVGAEVDEFSLTVDATASA